MPHTHLHTFLSECLKNYFLRAFSVFIHIVLIIGITIIGIRTVVSEVLTNIGRFLFDVQLRLLKLEVELRRLVIRLC